MDEGAELVVSSDVTQKNNSALAMSKRNKLFCFVSTAFVALGLFIDFNVVSTEVVRRAFGDNALLQSIGRILLSLPLKSQTIPYLLSVILILLGRYFVHQKMEARLNFTSLVLGCLAAFSALFGRGLEDYGDLHLFVASGSQIIKTIWMYASLWYCFSIAFTAVFLILDETSGLKPSPSQGNKSIDSASHSNLSTFESHVGLISFVVIILCWLPVLISCYPSLFSADADSQISQWFGINNWTSDYLNLLDPGVLINSHHPVLHTALMGSVTQFVGKLTGSYNIGIFIYTLIQYCAVAGSLSYSLVFIRDLKFPRLVLLLMLAFYTVNPIFLQYALFATKDTLFACSTLILFIFLIKLFYIQKELRLRDRILFPVSLLGFIFLRNGTAVLVFILFAVTIFMRNRTKRFYAPCFISVLVFYLLVQNILFPALSITPGSQREMLSIPIQQVSRCITEHDQQITAEQKMSIDAVIDYETALSKYDPNKSDPVKSTFNESASKSDVRSFLQTWIQLLNEYPLTCIEATMNNYYGYLYISDSNTAIYMPDYCEKYLNDAGHGYFGFHYLENTVLKAGRTAFDIYNQIWQTVPVLSAFTASGTYSWILIISLAQIIRTKSRLIIPAVLVLLVFLVNLIGPCNATYYIRYMLPILFCSPLMIVLVAFARLSPEPAHLRA